MLKEEALAKNVKVIIPRMTGPARGVEECGVMAQQGGYTSGRPPAQGLWERLPVRDTQNWRQATMYSCSHWAGIHMSWWMVMGGLLNAPEACWFGLATRAPVTEVKLSWSLQWVRWDSSRYPLLGPADGNTGCQQLTAHSLRGRPSLPA